MSCEVSLHALGLTKPLLVLPLGFAGRGRARHTLGRWPFGARRFTAQPEIDRSDSSARVRAARSRHSNQLSRCMPRRQTMGSELLAPGATGYERRAISRRAERTPMSVWRANGPEADFATFTFPFSISTSPTLLPAGSLNTARATRPGTVQSKGGCEDPPLRRCQPGPKNRPRPTPKAYLTSLCVTSWTSCFFFKPMLRPWI
jgi:hypothetical protein